MAFLIAQVLSGLAFCPSLSTLLLSALLLNLHHVSAASENGRHLVSPRLDSFSFLSARGQFNYTCDRKNPCPNSTCCSKWGWCGSGPAYCGDGKGPSDYTCDRERPCPNGACCSKWGWCGYGSAYCEKGCQSDCAAVPECGQHAAAPGTLCPLNACCSQSGFCGTTAEHCGTGCQSNCEQPKPSGTQSDPQSRIVGYWQASNTKRPCGTMSADQIPVELLTHLNVAFGYISASFQVTNMDRVSKDVYQSIGNVKARNPKLKLIISLGGSSFTDPGSPCRDVFPSLVSSKVHRSTFISNLMLFLSEFGYDGVDFDWNLGATDREGSQDGVNYTTFLKELHDAIQAGSKPYLVTVTAPTLYQYLQHFDLANTIRYVDWINLVSYDLHRTWDKGSTPDTRVSAHTNLTEIDQALSLFWRAGVKPAKVVMGLASYGRSFHLTDASCWKPGCLFRGPGEAGPCTGTPGFLSYREVTDILARTGATSYLDEQAAVRYVVYGSNSWISYDDELTLTAKIAYAKRIGLSGLMIWAIDMDDGRQTVMRSVTKGASLPGAANTFTPANFKSLSLGDDQPAAGSVTSYGLLSLGAHAADVGFMLLTGDSYAVTSLRMRDDGPEPFVFIDCPRNLGTASQDETQSARVVCLVDDVEGCFRINEKGVEGTLVEMPDNCSPNTFARAISLRESQNQDIPEHLLEGKASPTSRVMDFTFDFNLGLARNDTNNTMLQVGYSNIANYWDKMIDAPAIQSRSLKGANLSDGVIAPRLDAPVPVTEIADKAISLKQDLSATLFWGTTSDCYVNGGEFAEAFGAFVKGGVDAKLLYGLTFAVTFGPDIRVQNAKGLIYLAGKTDLKHGIGGKGKVDVGFAGKGNPAVVHNNPVNLGDSKILTVGPEKNVIQFQPYYQLSHVLATYNNSAETNFNTVNGPAPFDGNLATHIISDLGGKVPVEFPPNTKGSKTDSDFRQLNKIQIPESNKLFSSTPDGGKVAIVTSLEVGLKIDFVLWKKPLPQMASANISILYDTLSEFRFANDPAGQTVCPSYSILTIMTQQAKGAKALGWDEQRQSDEVLNYDHQTPKDGKVCFPIAAGATRARKRDALLEPDPGLQSVKEAVYPDSVDELVDEQGDMILNEEKRQNASMSMPGWGYPENVEVQPSDFNFLHDEIDMSRPAVVSCRTNGCNNCEISLEDGKKKCCGCISMDLTHGYDDMPDCDYCIEDDGVWPSPDLLRRVDAGTENSLSVGEVPVSDDPLNGASVFGTGEKDSQSFANHDDEDEYGEVIGDLSKRIPGEATLSKKKILVCKQRYSIGNYDGEDHRYPAFPAPQANPWDGIQGGRWDTISRYWGNTSADCDNWDIGPLHTADRTWDKNSNNIRAKYNTEHVFEGQLIGDFFTWWLDQGQVRNQQPPPQFTSRKMSCTITLFYMGASSSTWQINGKDASFIQYMLTALGSVSHLDRLTIMQARPNQKKGLMFGGNQPFTNTKYLVMSQDEQLQSVKEMGLVFNYLNDPRVWDMFCATYVDIKVHLAAFDSWYPGHATGVQLPNLADEWNKYIRTTLDSLVRRSRDRYEWMSKNRAPHGNGLLRFIDLPYYQMWNKNDVTNKLLIKLPHTCPGLDPAEA